MKKLFILFAFLLLAFQVEGQSIIRANPFARAQVASSFPEKINNGTFDSGTYWAALFYLSISGGVCTYDDTGFANLVQVNTNMISQLEVSHNYTLKFDVTSGTVLRFSVHAYTGNKEEELIAITNYVTGSYSIDFSTPGTLTGYGIGFYISTGGGTGTLDNISLKER